MEKINRDRVEVLAPAGSYDIMVAVINAGADAVYLGGDCFGARAFAGNFNKEELLKTIEYAHIHGRKIYLTVNTLLKDNEIRNRLVEYLTPYYEAGLDAVIVQDMGAFKIIHDTFPDMAIHASTQMAITGSNGAKLLENMGATRVVTARELNSSEIKAIHDSCNVEIESFVHGALCYCYSGQCLLSSMNGGRSGNRGRCAQPCRLAYDVNDLEGNKLNDKASSYVLSPRDMCALKILPDVIDAGVYSLKIEGRMKNVTYAAGVTAMYRKYVDMYLEKGRKGYKVSDEDIRILMDIYNRGAFTTGYYNGIKGMDMMSVKRPNHMGTKALRVIDNKNGCVTFKALEIINPQDVFEIDQDNSFASGKSYMTGETFEVNLPRKYRLNKGMELFRVKNGSVTADIYEKYVAKNIKAPVDIFFQAELDKKSQLIMTHKATGICAAVEGDTLQAALKQPASEEKIASQLSKLGDTVFTADDVSVNILGDVFIPVGRLNELRRKCTENLEEAVKDYFKRDSAVLDSDKCSGDENDCELNINIADENVDCSMTYNDMVQDTLAHEVMSKSILVSTKTQAKDAVNQSDVDMIYYDFGIFEDVSVSEDLMRNLVEECHAYKKKSVLVLPHVFTQKHVNKLSSLIMQAGKCGIDAFLVRNMEQIGLISRLHKDNPDKISSKIVTDADMYVWNRVSFNQFIELAQNSGLELIKITLPYELTSDELKLVTRKHCDDFDNMSYAVRKAIQELNLLTKKPEIELVVYTHIPVMISEQCVRKTLGCCKKTGVKSISGDEVILSDKKKKEYTVKNICSYCYSVMYNSDILNISDMEEDIADIALDSIRYELISKDDNISDLLESSYNTNNNGRGHFILGVE